MQWSQLITTKRLGLEQLYNSHYDIRTEFQRDFDRLIFSPVFRRLQNKTQVFPLPGNIFVHNRLTHSLEVSCVGRSIGNTVGRLLSEKYPDQSYLFNEIGAVVAAACLAHDLGNPPFGHSGEKAIGTFFSEGEGCRLREKYNLSDRQWADFANFEGNANAFRLLTHQFVGRRYGGYVLTYSTLASVVKYPYEAIYCLPNKQKFGFFQTEKEAYMKIVSDLGIPHLDNDVNRFARYPLVYLVEAADDICYQLMDIEDAYKLKILSYKETCDIYMSYLDEYKCKRAFEEIFPIVSDTNEQIAYLRSSVVGVLIDAVSRAFIDNEEAILSGVFSGSLLKVVPDKLKNAYCNSSQLAVSRIYRSQLVVDIELAGYKIISSLLETFLDAAFSPHKSYSQQLLQRIPQQYDVNAKSEYLKIQSILDYISGMTDVYALDLYRKINGISLPTL